MNLETENITNFDTSYRFFEQPHTQEELYNYLKNGDLAEKQLACIQIEEISTKQHAQIFMQNLTGIDGKVREAVSFKLKTFIYQKPELFCQTEFYNIFLDALIDINGNICRNIITAIQPLLQNHDFCKYLCEKIIINSHNVIDTIENFSYKDRKYITNKEIFKLYWYLETLSTVQNIDNEALFQLLKRCTKIEEYTIREKTANLFKFLTSNQTQELNDINFDNNFYVSLALRK